MHYFYRRGHAFSIALLCNKFHSLQSSHAFRVADVLLVLDERFKIKTRPEGERLKVATNYPLHENIVHFISYLLNSIFVVYTTS